MAAAETITEMVVVDFLEGKPARLSSRCRVLMLADSWTLSMIQRKVFPSLEASHLLFWRPSEASQTAYPSWVTPPTVFKKMIILTQVLSGRIRWRPRRRPRPSKTTTRRAAAIRTSSAICAPGSIPASSSGDETCTERGRKEGEGCGEEKEADCVEEEAARNWGCRAGDEWLRMTKGRAVAMSLWSYDEDLLYFSQLGFGGLNCMNTCNCFQRLSYLCGMVWGMCVVQEWFVLVLRVFYFVVVIA